MHVIKSWILGDGIVIALVGAISFPGNPGISPERDTSLFHNLADYGMFTDHGSILLVLGILLLLIAVLIPSRSRKNNNRTHGSLKSRAPGASCFTSSCSRG